MRTAAFAPTGHQPFPKRYSDAGDLQSDLFGQEPLHLNLH